MAPTITPLRELICCGNTIALDAGVLVMGVLNVTPDSFSDGGKYNDPEAAWDRAQELIEDGANLLDIGGESTRPGATYIDEGEEVRRLKPVLRVLGKKSSVPLSIDTRKAAVARMALDLGVVLVNDVSSLQDDPEMPEVVQTKGAGLVLMHRRGHSSTMHHRPMYKNVVNEVKNFLGERLAFAQSQGIASSQIIFDPGIGFGKNVNHNLQVLANIDFISDLGRPVLIGVSRKSFLGELTQKSTEERELGHAAVLATSIWQGAQIVRVHDVETVRDVVCVAQAVRNARQDSSS